jgi:hypothetical protein
MESSKAAQGAASALRAGNVRIASSTLPVNELPRVLSDLHTGMSDNLKRMSMRLLHIKEVRTWKTVLVGWQLSHCSAFGAIRYSADSAPACGWDPSWLSHGGMWPGWLGWLG